MNIIILIVWFIGAFIVIRALRKLKSKKDRSIKKEVSDTKRLGEANVEKSDITIGKYKINRLLGEGGMAHVYEAEHEQLGKKAAIKVLKKSFADNHQISTRFFNEAKLMATLDHPNILKVYDFDNSNNQLAIIMEYLEGEDLNEIIKKNHKTLSVEKIKDVFIQVLSALQYAHDNGLIHRDIKPSNIFVLKNGQIKILDFGISKLVDQANEFTQTGTQMGTPVYMSPEQVKGEKIIDLRSDIYSIGVTMYTAICGESPYNCNTNSQFDIFNKIVYEDLPISNVDSLFKNQIIKACQKNRNNRYQSCEEWMKDINSLQRNNETSTFNQVSNNENTIIENTANLLQDKTVFEQNDNFQNDNTMLR
jgi:serine/threonine protein kinase